MHQNVVAFHATNRMLDKDADLTQGFIHSLLFIAQLRVRVLYSCAAFLSECQSDHPCSQIAYLGSLSQPEHGYLQTSPTQVEPLVSTCCNRDGDHSMYDPERPSTC